MRFFLLLLAPIMRPLYRNLVAMRTSQFALLPALPGGVLFLGDSITEQGVWAEWFPELDVVNRGIGGDTVGGVANRLSSAVHRPHAVSLMIGTNDFSGYGTSRKPARIAAQMSTLLSRLREAAPEAVLLVHSVLPRSSWLAEDIQELNSRYRQLAVEQGATFVDLWPAFTTPERSLRPDLSGDGTHLNGAGYQVWVDILEPHLAPFARTTERAPDVNA